MDYIDGKFDSDECEALNTQLHSQLPALIRRARPPTAVSLRRLLLSHWPLIVVAALSSGAGVVMAVVWPPLQRTGAIMWPGRQAAPHAVDSAPLPRATTTEMTTAIAPSAAGFNTAEPGQDDVMRPERTTSVMAPDRQAQLLKRGSDFLRDGNVAAARLMLQSAADAGNSHAALLLGATYDPHMLADLGVRGLQPDREAARTWYRRAQQYGSSEASGRIERLAQMDR